MEGIQMERFFEKKNTIPENRGLYILSPNDILREYIEDPPEKLQELGGWFDVDWNRTEWAQWSDWNRGL